ncbi:hypothetical protein [Leifsonia sp. EB34]|uniref:YobI family P-loop NTPase n=1 Tax=Leifsonia sp. EB34 TaxID=3156303 RepID=UPI0035154DF8
MRSLKLRAMAPRLEGVLFVDSLRSLAPDYVEEQHGLYVEVLLDAIDNKPNMRNIALTGAYGTGKSSILSEIARRYSERVLEISLSTVGTEPESFTDDPKLNHAASTTSNRIQKEIVKQILYRDKPSATRGSRFQRISRFDTPREIGIAFGIGALILAGLYLTSLSRALVAVAGKELLPTLLAYAALYLLIAGVVFALRWLTHNRVFLEKLTAGPATVSLATTATSYFDQYIDEIVYYFEVSGRDVVILEDLDRFEDVRIFEALRALNTLLNGAQQITQRRRRRKDASEKSRPDVKFIYALRDSVFERLGTDADAPEDDAARSEVQRANRTKFFDLVVPVVPFITHRNSRDLMIKRMEGTGVSRSLINLAAHHVADMRLIENIRNEFDVFAAKLLRADNTVPSLDADRLFAMILYKSFHMADFERIRFGTSQLDKLHTIWRNIVEDSIDAENDAYQAAQKAVDSAANQMARSARLGARLSRIAEAAGRGGYSASYALGGTGVQPEALTTVDFWRKLAKEKSHFTVGTPYMQLVFTYADLEGLMGESLDVAAWDEASVRAGRRRLQAASDAISFLRHNTWEEMWARTEFTTDATVTGETFEAAARRLLESNLSQDLVKHGYITDYFALYISVFYGQHLRRDALNFVIHALDQGEPDVMYPLKPADVEAILNDKGDEILDDRSAYNVNIVDYLLQKDDDRIVRIADQLSTWERVDVRFIDRYIANGAYPAGLISRLTPATRQILTYVTGAAVSDEVRAALADAVLTSWDAAVDYEMDDTAATYLVTGCGQFPSLTKPKHSGTRRSMAAIKELGLKLPAIKPLNKDARELAIRDETYELNIDNLRTLLGSESVALDHMKMRSARVYQTVLSKLAQYASAVDADDVSTVDNPGEFVNVLAALGKAGADRTVFEVVVSHADPDGRAEKLASIPPESWPFVVASGRTTASYANVHAYIDTYGLDASIANLLRDAQAISAKSGIPESEKKSVALKLVGARELLPEPAIRAGLAHSLELETYIAADELAPEPGSLAGELLRNAILEDSEMTFASALMGDWPSREFAITQSDEFSTFITPATLPPDQLSDFFRSGHIPEDLKEAALKTLTTYGSSLDRDTKQAAITFAASRRAAMNNENLWAACEGLRPSPDLITVISLALLDTSQLRAVLRSFGGEYALVADLGTKRPTFPDDEPHRLILETLKRAQIVNQIQPEKGRLRVTLKRP